MSKLLKGDISLVKTFWVYGVGGMAVLFFFMNQAYKFVETVSNGYTIEQVVELYNNPADMNPEFFNASLLYFAIMIITTIYSLIMNVAVWRSSAKYDGAVIFRYGARILILLGFFDAMTGI